MHPSTAHCEPLETILIIDVNRAEVKLCNSVQNLGFTLQKWLSKFAEFNKVYFQFLCRKEGVEKMFPQPPLKANYQENII